MHQPRVVAREAADERAAGELREVSVLERAHLARRELQMLRDRVDRQPVRLARGTKLSARSRYASAAGTSSGGPV